MPADLTPVDTSIALKANLLHAMGVSTFLFLSIIAIAEKKNHNKFIPIALLMISLLVLVVTTASYVDEFYNKVATYDGEVSLAEKADSAMHILVISALFIVELSYVMLLYR